MKYKVIRKKRKSLSIVVKNGIVTVLAPKRLSLTYINSFVEEKQYWIDKKLLAFNEASKKFKDIFTYKGVMFFGKFFEIKPDECAKKFQLTDSNLLCPIKYLKPNNSKKININSQFILALRRFIKRLAKNELFKRLEAIANENGFEFSQFALSDARTKWGSCDSKKKIMLNFRLIMLNEELIKYVIIHELCHTRICNHSAEFWREVEKYYPNYKQSRKSLKENSILTNSLRVL